MEVRIIENLLKALFSYCLLLIFTKQLQFTRKILFELVQFGVVEKIQIFAFEWNSDCWHFYLVKIPTIFFFAICDRLTFLLDEKCRCKQCKMNANARNCKIFVKISCFPNDVYQASYLKSPKKVSQICWASSLQTLDLTVDLNVSKRGAFKTPISVLGENVLVSRDKIKELSAKNRDRKPSVLMGGHFKFYCCLKF